MLSLFLIYVTMKTTFSLYIRKIFLFKIYFGNGVKYMAINIKYNYLLLSNPYKQLIPICFNDANMKSINTFIKVTSLSSIEIEYIKSKHPEYTTHPAILQNYIRQHAEHMQIDQMLYMVDKQTTSGYNKITCSKEEIALNEIPEECSRYRNKDRKDYMLFSLTHMGDLEPISIKPHMNNSVYNTDIIRFNNLKEAETTLRDWVIRSETIYYLIKSDLTRAYTFKPKYKFSQTSTSKDAVPVHPVYIAYKTTDRR